MIKFVLVGAGSAQFGCDMLGDIFSTKSLEGSHITLLDINPNALKKVYDYVKGFIETNKLNFTVDATTERKEAFKNADFIISSIEVGDRFLLWDQDWKIPMQYGIHQVYGENGGAGGVFHSLRIIPHVLDIVKDAIDICPNAYIFNFSNPMTAICTAVKRAYPDAKFIGMCHEIGWLHKWLPKILRMNYESLDIKAGGLNHFSCLLEIKDKKSGKDLYPYVLKNAYGYFEHEVGYSDLLKYAKENNSFSKTENFDHSIEEKLKGEFIWADRRLLKVILDNYKLLPITVDSHFGEYIAWAWDVSDHRGILDFYELYRTVLSKAEPKIELIVKERASSIIDAIVTGNSYTEEAVNILNDGLIEDLPNWIAVEVPAVISKNKVEGVKLNNVPKGFLSLLRNYVSVYDLTAEAAIHKKREYAIQAILANPVVNVCKNTEDMLDTMISCQKPYLDYLK
ncbi:alpha-glucosidase [Brachyspira innocens]|uniref:family 4 glycosyl hydrolase n=1 Tax=Brachyspira innocens TaxID=13264 RepID=UPI0026EEBFE3|nr:alpha-glucosidase [Brachyspira innocens]